MKKLVFFAFICLFAVTACSDSGSDREIPTIVPDAQDTTQPQSEDPTPTQENLTPTERPARPTLPPTWTPTLPPTEAPPTETPVPQVDSQAAQPADESEFGFIGDAPECEGFGPDTSLTTEEFRVGESPVVAWRSVPTASVYWLLILDVVSNPENPRLMHEEYITETSFAIPADVFTQPNRYGWEVRPLDQVGVQMCQGRGGLLIAR